MGLWARWRARRGEATAERIRAAAREDDAEDAEAARERLLGLAPNELPVGWPADQLGDWRWDGSGWRHRWGGWR